MPVITAEIQAEDNNRCFTERPVPVFSLDDVVNDHGKFLSEKYPAHAKMFRDRLNTDPEAARAEAVIFSALRQAGYEVAVNEDTGKGGADFLCTSREGQIVAEVRCIRSSTVAQHSKWPEKVSEEAHFFGPITDVIRQCVSSKISQLAEHPFPRVLCLTTEHWGGGVLFHTLARDIMTSETKISMPVGSPNPSISITTDLGESVFFRFDKDGHVQPCRQSISAILLAHVHGDGTSVLGLLHPQPQVELPIGMLPNIPFLRASNWPFADGIIQTEWIIARPSAKRFIHFPAGIMDEKLRVKKKLRKNGEA